jgi:anti-sigma factor RsiW
MSCKRLRDRLLSGEAGEEIARHFQSCPECARFAARWEGTRAALGHGVDPVEVVPHPAFACRVVARLPGSAEVLGGLALRALPAAVVLALALAWAGLDQAPLPATSLLADDPGSEAFLTYSVLAPEGTRR